MLGMRVSCPFSVQQLTRRVVDTDGDASASCLLHFKTTELSDAFMMVWIPLVRMTHTQKIAVFEPLIREVDPPGAPDE